MPRAAAYSHPSGNHPPGSSGLVGPVELTLRALALTAAVVHLVLSLLAAALMDFAVTFPFENESPGRTAAEDWLLRASRVVAVLAIVLGGAVVARRVALAAIAAVAQLVVG